MSREMTKEILTCLVHEYLKQSDDVFDCDGIGRSTDGIKLHFFDNSVFLVSVTKLPDVAYD